MAPGLLGVVEPGWVKRAPASVLALTFWFALTLCSLLLIGSALTCFEGNDDFRSMEEVVGRRYGRLSKAGREFPDLVVIDGGAGQVSSAVKAFTSLEIDPPPMIGLAKREESIVFPDGREEMVLDPRDLGLRMLQQVRDEAHRFANQYNADLRSKRIKESILDDFKGLGAVRKVALLTHFGSIEKLRKATSLQIQELEGIGAKLADRLQLYLSSGKNE